MGEVRGTPDLGAARDAVGEARCLLHDAATWWMVICAEADLHEDMPAEARAVDVAIRRLREALGRAAVALMDVGTGGGRNAAQSAPQAPEGASGAASREARARYELLHDLRQQRARIDALIEAVGR